MGEENYDDYDDNLFENFGEGFEDEFEVDTEKSYDEAFEEEQEKEAKDQKQAEEEFLNDEQIDESEYEFDSVVGGRDKKPIMSLLNKGKLSKYEMDDLLNQL